MGEDDRDEYESRESEEKARNNLAEESRTTLVMLDDSNQWNQRACFFDKNNHGE